MLESGEWDSVNLRPGRGEGMLTQLPHIVGSLTKKY